MIINCHCHMIKGVILVAVSISIGKVNRRRKREVCPVDTQEWVGVGSDVEFNGTTVTCLSETSFRIGKSL